MSKGRDREETQKKKKIMEIVATNVDSLTSTGCNADCSCQFFRHLGCIYPTNISPIYHKNAGHNMAIVGEPYNVDAHAKIPGVVWTV